MAETGGRVVVVVGVGVGTAGAPGMAAMLDGVGVAAASSAMVWVASVLMRFGRGELGRDGAMCWFGVSSRVGDVDDILIDVFMGDLAGPTFLQNAGRRDLEDATR